MNTHKTFLIMDTRRCLDCGNCERACERRHGEPRFDRHGFEVGYIRVPTTCKDCVDPECVAACRFQAMIKTRDRLTQPTEMCVGCNLCARKCPFGAINMLPAQVVHEKILPKKELKTQRKFFFVPGWLQRSNGGNGKMQNIPVASDNSQNTQPKKAKRKREVWKCDACAGYKKRACVYNCPTGALREVTLDDLVKEIPREWGQILVEYLAPAFLTREEKEAIREGKLRLVVTEDKRIELAPVEKVALVA